MDLAAPVSSSRSLIEDAVVDELSVKRKVGHQRMQDSTHWGKLSICNAIMCPYLITVQTTSAEVYLVNEGWPYGVNMEESLTQVNFA